MSPRTRRRAAVDAWWRRYPFPTLGALKAARTAEDNRIIDWVDGLTDAALASRFTYTASVDKRTVS